MPSLLTIIALAVVASTADTPPPTADPVLEHLLARRGVKGTIVVASLDGRAVFVAEPTRASERFLPASTFKIPNTLIALDRKVVAPDEVVRWDGVDRGNPEWNRDQTLAPAFSSSCVWYYQELARRLGADAYRSTLAGIGYGNAAAGPDVTTFWLDGELRISALEQISFLRAVVRRELPFSPAAYDVLRRIMVVDQTPAYTLRAKTGWAARVSPQIGWYVGTVEKGDEVWLFAVNVQIDNREQLTLRRELALAALRAKGVL